jgi:predicted phosphodiesterase
MVCAALAVIAIGAAPAAAGWRLIASPTLGEPALVRPGDAFTVRLDCAKNKRLHSVRMRGFKDPDVVLELSSEVFDCAGDLELPVKTPHDAPAGLYGLCVDYESPSGDHTACQDHAVSVSLEFKQAFRFAILTDFHVGDARGEKNNPGIPLQELRAKAMAAVNAAKPDFVLLTGDITFYPTTYENDYRQALEELVRGLNVPVFMTPGNHDLYSISALRVDGESFWADTFGPVRKSFTYGPFRFIGFNSYNWPEAYRDRYAEALVKEVGSSSLGIMGAQEFEWIRDRIQEAHDMGLRPILFAHHDPQNMSPFAGDDVFSVVQRDAFAQFLQDQGVEYYFFGHTHKNYTREHGDVLFISTGTASSGFVPGEAWSFRIVDVDAAGDLTMRPVVVWTPVVNAGK